MASLAGLLLTAGCDRLTGDPADAMLSRPAVRVAPRVLDSYVGTYRLASGAHYPVIRDGDRLLGGTPPHELLPQTTRHFQSNQLFGEFHFERSETEGTMSLRRRIAKRDYHCKRIDPNVVADPTRRVSVGDHALRMLVIGAGRPTIVLEDGFGNGIDWQAELQADLAALSTVVTYDHAGTGGSDSGPPPRDGRHVAHELRQALETAGLPAPYLLLGASIGGDYVRIFAHEFPTDTAGLILLDPTPEWDRLDEWAKTNAPARAAMYRQLERDGDVLMDRLMNVQEPGRSAEWSALEATRQQAREAYPLPDVPIVQITGAGGRQTVPAVDDKVQFFEAWLQQHLPQAKHVLAPNSGHAVPITDRRLVLDEVRQMLAAVRQRSDALPP